MKQRIHLALCLLVLAFPASLSATWIWTGFHPWIYSQDDGGWYLAEESSISGVAALDGTLRFFGGTQGLAPTSIVGRTMLIPQPSDNETLELTFALQTVNEVGTNPVRSLTYPYQYHRTGPDTAVLIAHNPEFGDVSILNLTFTTAMAGEGTAISSSPDEGYSTGAGTFTLQP
jgi:hypothetical protein